MSFSEKFEKCLGNEPENHILPFFWQHGEEDEVILEELHRIYDSGVGALCVESRPHEGFAKEPWWEDMTLILEESKKLGLEVWVLDDKYFPTGFCNGIVRTKYPHLGKRGITERHLDVRGPVTDGAVILEGWADEDDTFLGAVAVRRPAALPRSLPWNLSSPQSGARNIPSTERHLTTILPVVLLPQWHSV